MTLAGLASLAHPCPIRRAEALCSVRAVSRGRLEAAHAAAAARHEEERASVAFLADEAEGHEGAEAAALERRRRAQERRFLDGARRLDRVCARLATMPEG